MKKILVSRWTKVLLFLVCLVPLMQLAWQAWKQDLTANPVEYITHDTGDWTIRFLMITLTVTPLRMLLNQPLLVRFRRMVGLFAFLYGCLHLTTWLVLDKYFDWSEMGKDILKRPYITMGMAAFAMMVPLAVTSTAGWVRRLGFRRWQKLHRLVYFSALAGVIHYYWLVKSDIRLPLLYAAILGVLMGYRLMTRIRTRGARTPVVEAAR
jgi:methionine sulfoxide reductase heme-binding subunit